MTTDEIRAVSAATLEKWHAMPEEEQTRIIMQATYASCTHDSYIRRGDPAEYFGAAWIEISEKLDLTRVIRINTARVRAGKSSATIGRIVNQIVRAMIMREHYAQGKDYSSRIDIQYNADIDEQSNDSHSYHSSRIDQIAAPRACEPEAAYDDSAMIKWLAKQSPFDQIIIRALLDGWTEKEIAAEIGCNQSTVSRHRTAMQAEMIDRGFTRGYIKRGA